MAYERGCGVDAAEAGDEAHRIGRAAEGLANGANDARADGCCAALVDVLVEHAAAEGPQAHGVVEQFGVGHRAKVGTLLADLAGEDAVGFQFRLVHVAHGPVEPLLHLRRGRRVFVPGFRDIGRDVGVVAEVGGVDGGGRHAGRAFAPDADPCRAQVAIAADEADEVAAIGVGVEFVGPNAEAVDGAIAPARDGAALAEDEIPARRARGFGKDFADVRARQEGRLGIVGLVLDPANFGHFVLPPST